MGTRIKNYDVYDIISKNIRRYRKEAHMTQDELAMKANYSYQFIRRIEAPKVKKTFSLDTVYRIALALNRRISEMFDESVNDEENDTEENEDEKEGI